MPVLKMDLTITLMGVLLFSFIEILHSQGAGGGGSGGGGGGGGTPGGSTSTSASSGSSNDSGEGGGEGKISKFQKGLKHVYKCSSYSLATTTSPFLKSRNQCKLVR